MNPAKSLLAAAVVAAASASAHHAQAANLDLAKLAGHYRATYTLVVGSTTVSGKVDVNATPMNQGSKVKLTILGFAGISSTPGSYVLYGTHILSKSSIKSNNALLAFYVQIPASARVTGSQTTARFTLANNTGFVGSSVSISYTLKFTGRRLSIVGTGNLGSSPINISLVGQKG
jgi:hypothetical protein